MKALPVSIGEKPIEIRRYEEELSSRVQILIEESTRLIVEFDYLRTTRNPQAARCASHIARRPVGQMPQCKADDRDNSRPSD